MATLTSSARVESCARSESTWKTLRLRAPQPRLTGRAGYHGGNRVFVDHLRHGISQQHDVLIKRFDLALQLDAIDQIDRYGNVLFAQRI